MLYKKYLKRPLDLTLSLIAIVILSPVLLMVACLVRIKLGTPIIFKQKRPGLNEKIFTMYKFRSMTDKKDNNGELLSDSERLTSFGKWLRSTSLDELPELFNIIKGDMSIVGPRPQLVKDMVFMTPEQRKRHTVRPGLTGLAQVSGRNSITWENKLRIDLEYIKDIHLLNDIRIVISTFFKVFKKEDISQAGYETGLDLGDHLMKINNINQEEYELLFKQSNELISIHGKKNMLQNKQSVTVLIPIRNEEKYIEKFIQSLLNQDYPKTDLKIIFIDGSSLDNTKKIINNYIRMYPELIEIFDNPKKTVPYAMNIGIKDSKSEIIVRMDAHSEYPENYISSCISTIKRINADNVGGLAITKGIGLIGEAFAEVLSSKFGVGNSSFRTNANSGFVDTVPFGTFYRETFHKFGFFDERLTRNQDYELNYRIRKKGGKVYLNSEIKLTYFCRNTLKSIISQSYENGKWNILTSKLCPGTMSLRHFIPMLFVLTILMLLILSFFSFFFLILLIIELSAYLFVGVLFFNTIKNKIRIKLISMILLPIFHFSYGIGSLIGIFQNI